MRVRAVIALLSQELLGIPMTLVEFPVLKSIRGIGMSDNRELAEKLAEKLDYTNTFYHQPPQFDVTKPDPSDLGRYDFILSTEVMEHVPPPVEDAFANLCRMLKPEGLLVMTTPYQPGETTIEHFPELHDFTLASLREKTVLVNRRRDGSMEIFDDLFFHGGPGATIEMRVFREESLRNNLLRAGFSSVHFSTENVPEFGIEHAETWSLPIVARKGHFHYRSTELARQYREVHCRAEQLQEELARLQAEYERHVAHHEATHQEMSRKLVERHEWGSHLDREKEELERELIARTGWAQGLDREIAGLRTRIEELEAKRGQLEARKWTRLGRKLGALE
jgi:SAM-dependent methyltransferase